MELNSYHLGYFVKGCCLNSVPPAGREQACRNQAAIARGVGMIYQNPVKPLSVPWRQRERPGGCRSLVW